MYSSVRLPDVDSVVVFDEDSAAINSTALLECSPTVNSAEIGSFFSVSAVNSTALLECSPTVNSAGICSFFSVSLFSFIPRSEEIQDRL